ncbi:MAG TPA: hypothetical protein VIU81_09340 [Gaiellaceae bacterium]
MTYAPAERPPHPEAVHIAARVSAPSSLYASWRHRNWGALKGRADLVRTWRITYRAHDGLSRDALVVLPRWYGPKHDPAIPLVISPHGRGATPTENARFWGNLPALGRFAVVNPEGQGARLALYSWGSPGQISDLARMPEIVRRALPWLRIAPDAVYAVGGSMGGQETLLLVAEHPHLLAGAISFDAPTNMAARYSAFPELKWGLTLQRLARLEFGGIPRTRGDLYADRSPIYFAREIARSNVPLEIWWSRDDRVVVDQARESGLLYHAIKRLKPSAPVVEYVGWWQHTAEMRSFRRLPLALAAMGLLDFASPSAGVPV